MKTGLLIAALPNDGVAVYPADDPCADVWASYALARGVRTLTYATAEGVAADVRGELVPGKGLRLLAYGIDRVIGLQVQGAHNIHNAVGAAAAALAQQLMSTPSPKVWPPLRRSPGEEPAWRLLRASR